jgi:hypothetical protein
VDALRLELLEMGQDVLTHGPYSANEFRTLAAAHLFSPRVNDRRFRNAQQLCRAPGGHGHPVFGE